MPLQPLSNGSELLHKLLADYLGGHIDTPLFCSSFEHALNFDVNRGALTRLETAVFEWLFNEVVYFSPFPDERVEIPNYRTEQQIREAASAAQAELAANG